MLSLTRIFLHNWHRFTHHIIDVEDSLYLAGHNGSGKSSVLDALQVVLIADRRVRFNSSAQERSGQRTLDTYVRGKLGENKWLRPGATIGYIALEFRNAADHTACTVGVCIEASHDRQAERTFFVVPDALDVALFVADGRERTRRQLRDTLKNRRGARSFEQVGEYQDQLLTRLGGLNQRFFDLFLKALTFQPIRNIREFVEQWLLEEQSLDLDTLRLVKERLTDLRRHAGETQSKLAALREIVEQQHAQRRLRHIADTYAVLLALLHEAAATHRVAELHAMIESLTQERAAAEVARAAADAAYNGAQTAYIDAKVRLQQLDVVRRRDELQTQIARLTSQADAVRQRWYHLRDALRGEAQAVAPFVTLAPFEPNERAAIDALLLLITGLADAAPPSVLTTTLDAAVPALDAATEKARQQRFDAERHLRGLHDRRRALQADLARLLDPNSRPTYPPDVERLRDLLAPVVGERPRLLCELLDVPDERWQDAVEAMLGGRRFNVIVPPQTFSAALRELNRARAVERLYDVGLLDLDKARTEARPARPNSLAGKVHTPSKPIRAYIDTVLGDIITCETVDELRAYRRAVTPDVVVYGEWTARAVPPHRYRPWQIGQQARQSQIESAQAQIATIDQEIAERTPERDNWRALVNGLDRKATLLLHRRELDLPLDDEPLRVHIAEAERELQALDWSGVAALEQEATRLKQIMDGEREDVDRFTARLAELRATLHTRNQEHHAAQRELAERTTQAQATRAQLSHAVPDAEQELRKRQAQPDSTMIAAADAKAKEFDTKANNVLQTLIGLGTDYNTRYQFVALPANPNEERYAAEEQRLGETDLPRYADHIAQAEREAEEELREHVLHRLREQIVGARQQLERINDALRDTPFHGDRYRFVSEPDNELRPFYDLINEAHTLGTTALHESEFYNRHRAAFDQFYDALTRTARTDEERREQERLTDYRRYLSYDIEVRHADGTVSRLSKLMGHTSGGETQTPFYVTIAASFVQLYRVGERSGQATTRLVAFDEAFSKMDQDRIGATLDLFQHFKLQIITATPLERCEYLVPKMCTSVVLTGVADQVLIEPYRNYAARLDGPDGA